MSGALSAIAFEHGSRKRCLRSFVPLDAGSLDANSNSGWAHVAMLGTWEGHAKGSFAFTHDAFAQILKNFDAQRNPIPWDYEHDTFNGATTGPKPASGWVRQLQLRANGTELWAYVDWTPRAAQMIRDGEYRFCSPVVDFASLDRKTNEPIGAELLSVALTNNPFLDGQHPIELTWTAADMAAAPPPQSSSQQQPPRASQQNMQDCPKCGTPNPVGARQCSKCGAALATQEKPPAAKPASDAQLDAMPPPIEPPSKEAAEAAQGNAADADADALLSGLADAAGIDKAQALAALWDLRDELISRIQKTIGRDGTPAEATRTMTVEKKNPEQAPAAGNTEPATQQTQQTPPVQAAPPSTTTDADKLTLDELERKRDKELIAAMQERLAVIERERAEEKKAAIASLVDEKIAAGYVKPDQRETAIWAFTTDRARAEQIYAEKLIPIGTRQTQAGTQAPNANAQQHNAGPDGQTIDMSQFTRAEVLTIECLMGAHKTRSEAAAIVLKRRSITAN